MKDLFFMGGAFFMSILTILIVCVVGWIIYHLYVYFTAKQPDKDNYLRLIGYGKSIGLLAMITGIAGQLIGFYEALSTMEKAVDISPAMVYGGIKVSMISTLYGISIYVVSILLWLTASLLIGRRS